MYVKGENATCYVMTASEEPDHALLHVYPPFPLWLDLFRVFLIASVRHSFSSHLLIFQLLFISFSILGKTSWILWLPSLLVVTIGSVVLFSHSFSYAATIAGIKYEAISLNSLFSYFSDASTLVTSLIDLARQIKSDL